jgi:hypothetical protein
MPESALGCSVTIAFAWPSEYEYYYPNEESEYSGDTEEIDASKKWGEGGEEVSVLVEYGYKVWKLFPELVLFDYSKIERWDYWAFETYYKYNNWE